MIYKEGEQYIVKSFDPYFGSRYYLIIKITAVRSNDDVDLIVLEKRSLTTHEILKDDFYDDRVFDHYNLKKHKIEKYDTRTELSKFINDIYIKERESVLCIEQKQQEVIHTISVI